MEIIMIRHGESAANQAGIIALPDSPLTEKGMEQARRLQDRLKDFSYEEVYASPFVRAEQTARAFASEVRVDERLREHLTGAEGYSLKEMKKKYPTEFQQFMADPVYYRAPNCENRADVWERAMNFRNEMEVRNKNIVIVSHANFLSVMLSTIFGNVEQSMKFYLENAAISSIAKENGQWYLKCLNR